MLNLALGIICWIASLFMTASTSADEFELVGKAAPILREFCFDCHNNDNAEAHVNLEQLVTTPNYATRFRAWEKVVRMVAEKRMPPEDMLQPSDSLRGELTDAIRNRLDQIANDQAGDPGRVVMRRLTSAEYAYTIQDLTGLDLGLESILIGDAVGGEGFTNVGDVQFVQDSTLERYLEAAKRVASHAVIGSGPLQFFESPGKTGLELSAIHRIQAIYRQHGFRTAAGEGGEPFGMDLYPRAFFVAWQFRYREKLGNPTATLTQLAVDEGLNARFVLHVWGVLNQQTDAFPLSEITAAWRELPEPIFSLDKQFEQQMRQECQQVSWLLRNWQARLGRSAGDDEEAALLTKETIKLTPERSFRANIDWQNGDQLAAVHFVTASATGQGIENALVVWRNPTIQFRQTTRSRSKPVSLLSLLAEDSEYRALFGQHKRVNVGDTDLVIAGDAEVKLEFAIPPGARGARLTVEAELQTELAPACIVRCTVRDGSSLGDTAADTGEISAILGLSQGEAFETWRTDVLQLAQVLPDISQREPAPSDRDPIPVPFDNAYNNAERNDFHYSIKYHRDDDFLVQHMLDDSTRQQLDHAWHDLLSSFDYHDTYLERIERQRVGSELPAPKIANLRPDWIATLPDKYRSVVRRLVNSYIETQAAVRAAQTGHIEDALQFAQAAWRRPLTTAENDGLRAFYGEMRDSQQLDHPGAIRALLSRILVAPEFLYRVERPQPSAEVLPLSPWELASRLSYFLWSSPPDGELLAAAERGQLDEEAELARQTRRMLHKAKSRRFAAEFFGQWFGFYRFDQYAGIDTGRFPEFSDQLKNLMYDEAVSFFDYIVREERSADEILFANYAHWNQDLARHYGLASDRLANLANQTQLVEDVGPLHRGGLLGLGVVHATTSAPLRTSAVKRGDWILRRVLGTPVPPPPADVGSIPADDVLSDGKTVRDRLVAHRQDAACVNCHSRMDPLGFALENFDPIGRWRAQYRDGQPIDASGMLNDGVTIDGFDGLQSYLHDQLPKFHRILCSKLLGFALGRSEILSDRRLIEQMMADLQVGASLSQLATRIVTSPQFRTKRLASVDAIAGEIHGNR